MKKATLVKKECGDNTTSGVYRLEPALRGCKHIVLLIVSGVGFGAAGCDADGNSAATDPGQSGVGRLSVGSDDPITPEEFFGLFGYEVAAEGGAE